MDDRPTSGRQQSEFRFAMRDVVIVTTLIAISLPWIMPSIVAMEPAARWMLFMCCAITLSVPAVRFLIEFLLARRRTQLAGRLLYSHSPQFPFLKFIGLSFALGMMVLQVRYFADGPRIVGNVSNVIDVMFAIYYGVLISIFLNFPASRFFHFQIFEGGFFQFGRFHRWKDFRKMTIEVRSQQAILMLDALDESLELGRRRFIFLPSKELPVVKTAVGKAIPCSGPDQ